MSNISELARMAANGDRAAFDSLYEQTKSGVWFTCISLLKNEENAKDVMQETYIAAFEKLGSLADYGGVQSWLNKIAANKCKNYIRTIVNSALAENGEELIENIPDEKLIPEEYVTDMSKRKIIMDIIERSLSEEQYRTIILYYFDEMTAVEIAELMDCHEKTVLYRLKVARSKIKEEVMRYEEENKDKLHAVVFVPILTRLFRIEAENTSVPNVPIIFQDPPNTQSGVPSNAAAAAAKQGGKPMLNTLKAKIIACACAAAVVGGGVTAGVIISNNSKKPADITFSSPVQSAEKPQSDSNVSKPIASQNADSSDSGSSKPETSNPTVTDKVVYPKYEGLTPVKLERRVGDQNEPDIASGNIKEMIRSNTSGYLLLMNDGEIVYYYFDGATNPYTVSIGKDTGISTLENCYFHDDGSDFDLLLIDGKNILFKVMVKKTGEVRVSKQGNPREITEVLNFDVDVANIALTDLGEIYAFDAEGYGFAVKNTYGQHTELGPYNDAVLLTDDGSVYYLPPETKGRYFREMKVKRLTGGYFITDEGKVYECSGGGMISNKDPLEYLKDYSFTELYHNGVDNYGSSAYTGVTNDDKIVTFKTSTHEILFSGDKPDGTIQDIWQNDYRTIVKTDKGVFVVDHETDTGFRPVQALNGIDAEVEYISGKYVLLNNGFVYTIDEY